MLLLDALMHVKVIQQIRRPVTADGPLVQETTSELPVRSCFSVKIYLGFLGLSEFPRLPLLLRFFLGEGSSRSV